ncbi:MAG: hypothetical protein JNM01_24115 [Delftia acidovorans]|nr:hypothetical protein [Delftia acidovorans]
MPSLLPHVLRAFAEQSQERLELFEGLSAVAHPRLREGTLDLLIGRMPSAPSGGDLHGTPLFRYDATVVARAGHPLAGARSLAELMDCDWLLNYTPPPKRTTWCGACSCATACPCPWATSTWCIRHRCCCT